MTNKAPHQDSTLEFLPSPGLLKRAQRHMSTYTFVIRPNGEGGYVGTTMELPGVFGDGETFDECARHLQFAVETVVATYLADGVAPPPPAGEREKRTEQVNVRFTQTERGLLERESVQQGFRGIGDLIRAEMIRQFGSARPR